MKSTAWITAGLLAMLAAGGWAQTTQPATTQPASPWADKAPAGARVTAEGWFAPAKPRIPRPELPKEVTKAYVIPLDGPIDDTTYEVIKYKSQICRERGAELVIIDVNSPGGASNAMMDICKLLMEEMKGIYTVAFVNPEAISAAAVISMACTDVVMVPRGTIGDAMPIMIAGGTLQPMPAAERGKFESYMRADIRHLAADRGRNEVLCEAMITLTMEVWLIRDKATGELRIVDAAEWQGKVSGVPSKDPAQRGPADAPWEFIRRVDKDDELVTLETDKALALGLAQHRFKDMDALAKHYGVQGKPTVLEDRPLDTVARFLTSPAISGLLFMLALVAAYQEFRTPGLGIFGAVAVLCLVLLVGSRMVVGLANVVEVVVLMLGVILLIIEIFLIPGFGVAGISGIILIIGALLAMWIPNSIGDLPVPSAPGDWSLLTDGILVLLLGFTGGTLVSLLLARYLPQTRIAKLSKLVLAPTAATDAAGASVADDSPMRHIQPGDTGTVESTLRPVGTARFGPDLVDVVTEGEMIASGTKVRVLHRDGNRIVVEEVG